MMIQAKPPFLGEAEPVWEVAHLFPPQGQWSEEDYLALDTNHLFEYSHGQLEVLEMPTQAHQLIVIVLFKLLERFVDEQELGLVLLAPLRIQLWPGKFREPDIVFMLHEHRDRRGEQFWLGADLVVEVVSPESRRRDSERKKREYAQAAIPEYWLVDPEQQTVTVFTLVKSDYVIHGVFRPGEQATSRLLPGFQASVATLFAAAHQ
jgi:Uma2 family endonuclease